MLELLNALDALDSWYLRLYNLVQAEGGNLSTKFGLNTGQIV